MGDARGTRFPEDYRFESCPDYVRLVITKQQTLKLKGSKYSQVAELAAKHIEVKRIRSTMC